MKYTSDLTPKKPPFSKIAFVDIKSWRQYTQKSIIVNDRQSVEQKMKFTENQFNIRVQRCLCSKENMHRAETNTSVRMEGSAEWLRPWTWD